MYTQNRINTIFIETPLVWSKSIEARVYQQNIADKACTQNTLVVLPTALGKTIISALVAARLLYEYKSLRVLVMAPTRPLVLQHKESFMRILKLREKDTTLLTGKTASIYRRQIWDGSARIIFATPQVVKNDLKNGYLSLRDFSLIVFDECHRARKDYAYTLVASKYVEQSPWPIILGMTASPGSDKKRIEEICKALFIEQVEYRSEEDPDVAPYINPVQIEWRHVDLPRSYREISKIIKKILQKKIGWLNQVGLIHKKTEYVGRRDLLEVGENLSSRLKETVDEERGPLYNAIITQSAALTLFHALELLETQGIQTLRVFLTRVEKESNTKKSYKTVIKDANFLDLKNLLDRYSNLHHPKIPLMENEVKRQLKDSPKSRILVFTQYRDTASILVDRLKLTGISVKRFVGQASKIGDPGLTQEGQAEIIKDFREGDTDVLVATCIAEEGLDIPSVDLVIFYEPIPSEIRYIQRRGRTGRKTAGKAVILAARDTYDMVYLYASRRRVEKMKRIAGSLNTELQPLMRIGPKPKYDPLLKEEILKIEKEAYLLRMEPETMRSEEERVKGLIKESEKAARYIYKNTLEAGEKGVLIEDLIREYGWGGFTPIAIKHAIERLKIEGLIDSLDGDRVFTSSMSQNNLQKKWKRDIYEISVEKIYPGVAVIWIDDKWRARLTPMDFEGPPNLMKKGSRFKARGIIYHERGKLCFRVKEVVELLS